MAFFGALLGSAVAGVLSSAVIDLIKETGKDGAKIVVKEVQQRLKSISDIENGWRNYLFRLRTELNLPQQEKFDRIYNNAKSKGVQEEDDLIRLLGAYLQTMQTLKRKQLAAKQGSKKEKDALLDDSGTPLIDEDEVHQFVKEALEKWVEASDEERELFLTLVHASFIEAKFDSGLRLGRRVIEATIPTVSSLGNSLTKLAKKRRAARRKG